jgi:hypothetical protein
MDEATLIAAAERFKITSKTFTEVQEHMEGLELDVKLAIRSGFPPAASEKVRDEYRTGTWMPAYRERKASAAMLCEAIGVSIEELKYSL